MSDSVAEFRVEQSSHIVGRAVQFWAIKVVGVVLHPAPSHLEKVPPLRQKHHFAARKIFANKANLEADE